MNRIYDVVRRVVRSLDQSSKLLRKQSSQLDSVESLLERIRWESMRARQYAEIQQRVAMLPIFESVHEFYASRQLSFDDTLARVHDRRLSFARFGDGELKLMLRPEYKLKFQQNSVDLQQSLRNVFVDPPASLLIGLPHLYRDLHWSNVWADVWPEVRDLAAPLDVVGNSHVSRPVYFEYAGAAGVQRWRRLWDGDRVRVVTGEDSRFFVVDELFSNARDLSFTYSLSTNAFSDLPRVTDLLVGDSAKIDTVLISLGPAGTVLAAELARRDIRSIDIGHISDSYETAFSGGAWPESKPVTVKRSA